MLFTAKSFCLLETAMGGKKSDNIQIERVCGVGGQIDVSFDGDDAILAMYSKPGTLYVQITLGGAPYIEDLIGALQRVKRKAQKMG